MCISGIFCYLKFQRKSTKWSCTLLVLQSTFNIEFFTALGATKTKYSVANVVKLLLTITLEMSKHDSISFPDILAGQKSSKHSHRYYNANPSVVVPTLVWFNCPLFTVVTRNNHWRKSPGHRDSVCLPASGFPLSGCPWLSVPPTFLRGLT